MLPFVFGMQDISQERFLIYLKAWSIKVNTEIIVMDVEKTTEKHSLSKSGKSLRGKQAKM